MLRSRRKKGVVSPPTLLEEELDSKEESEGGGAGVNRDTMTGQNESRNGESGTDVEATLKLQEDELD